VNRFAYYTGGVLAFSALIPGRNQDEFGIAVATLELTYLAQFGSHLAVQPDLQFVMNPNTDPLRSGMRLYSCFDLKSILIRYHFLLGKMRLGAAK
jgi:hypothetical protein